MLRNTCSTFDFDFKLWKRQPYSNVFFYAIRVGEFSCRTIDHLSPPLLYPFASSLALVTSSLFTPLSFFLCLVRGKLPMTSFLLPNISIFSTLVRFSGKIKIPRQTEEMRENQGGCCEERNGEKTAHLIAVGGVGPLVDLTEYMDESSSEKTEMNRDQKF